MKGDIGQRVRDLIQRICDENEVDIISGAVSLDHVHILVSIRPDLSISKLVKSVKGETSHKLQMEYPSLRKEYWGRHLWARGYFCVSIGNVNEEMIKEYIEHHFEGDEANESFRIEER